MLWLEEKLWSPVVYDYVVVPVGDRVYFFGGLPECSSIHIFYIETKTSTFAKIGYNEHHRIIPADRISFALAAHKRKIYLTWGLVRAQEFVDDNLYCFDTETMYWCIPKTTGFVPLACAGHSACVIRNKMYTFGGVVNTTGRYTNTLHSLNLNTMEWSIIYAQGAHVHPTAFHSVAAVAHKMYIIGGINVQARGVLSVYCFDTLTNTWTQILSEVVPINRERFSTWVHRDYIFLYGGLDADPSDSGEVLNELWRYSVDDNVWEQMEVYGRVPQVSGGQRCGVVKDKVYVFCWEWVTACHDESDEKYARWIEDKSDGDEDYSDGSEYNAYGSEDNADGDEDNAGGDENNADGDEVNATGDKNNADGDEDNADGDKDNADGDEDNADGDKDNADGDEDNADGDKDNADGDEDNADGDKDNADGDEDNADGDKDNADGDEDNADGDEDNADGDEHNADGDEDNADGDENNADGEEVNTDGDENNADGDEDNADGDEDNADGAEDNADGDENNADGDEDNADGDANNADGDEINTDGDENNADGDADGDEVNADGDENNADGDEENADGDEDNADGDENNADREADGDEVNADGDVHNADGDEANAEGDDDNADVGEDNADGDEDNADGDEENADGYEDNSDGDEDYADGDEDNADLYYDAETGVNCIYILSYLPLLQSMCITQALKHGKNIKRMSDNAL